MAEIKRIMISIPEGLLEEIDGIVAMDKLSRSQFVRNAMSLYIADRRRKAIIESMRKGYQEMAAINLSLAEEGVFVDVDVVDISSLLVEREQP